MDKESIIRVEQLALAGQSIDTDIPARIIPQGSQSVSLEKFQAQPTRHRAVFNSARVEEFIGYCNDYATTGDSAVFINPNDMTAIAVFDYSGWGQHRAILKLEATPEYSSIMNKPKTIFIQSGLREWLEDFGESIQPMQNGVELKLNIATQAVAKVSINKTGKDTFTDGDFSATRSAFEEIEAKSGVESGLPTHFLLTAPLFEGLEPRQINLKFAVITQEKTDKPVFALRIIGLDALLKAVAKEVEQKLRKITNTVIYIGTVAINQPV
jgi:uncharacterized protein YfdQ (DUF2303 family)